MITVTIHVEENLNFRKLAVQKLFDPGKWSEVAEYIKSSIIFHESKCKISIDW